MNKTRIETFSDGVLAIIITIMVLEIKVPHEVNLQALIELFPIFTSYLMSFVFVGIYWVNHHHLFHTVKHVNGKILWANMGLLFALSMIPFSTGWMGENHFAALPVAIYSTNLLVCGFAAFLLQSAITAGLPKSDKIFEVIKRNMKKTIVSVLMNIISVVCAFFYPMISLLLTCVMAAIWIVPDRRIEKLMDDE
ncbi:MAG: TMEM175 family protein [Bacteroidota bacterium]|nr:TMEM175 family protein [Bacteroidota bacterium]